MRLGKKAYTVVFPRTVRIMYVQYSTDLLTLAYDTAPTMVYERSRRVGRLRYRILVHGGRRKREDPDPKSTPRSEVSVPCGSSHHKAALLRIVNNNPSGTACEMRFAAAVGPYEEDLTPRVESPPHEPLAIPKECGRYIGSRTRGVKTDGV
ncbi:uncharacterized protein MYCFIDRAFT_170909 [Pseudocercospora fijiensis CIRAD86]|uniref:Uncharacterized protein n=1 Tax=Pseudocercospora fijiensis (strain CIRAD86) TaxID=383855 RepID=N1QCK3_PSEFD|nr:uncharacterized protein MYCFIDRAFT_170909 [Pseudocercospora fijiensis CIRAD86]EME89447.1 hypothetical protein MYCFIDRAFT_170909 [Pseudocercospora fijiensis CIRAD86]